MALALAIFFASTFPVLVITVTAFAFFAAPIIPLVDNSSLEYLGEQKKQYGKLRLWGAVGWGVAAPVVGQLVERLGLGWSFYGYGLFMLAGLVISFRLPISAMPSIGKSFWQGVRLLLGQPAVVVFSGAHFYRWDGFGAYSQLFVSLYEAVRS